MLGSRRLTAVLLICALASATPDVIRSVGAGGDLTFTSVRAIWTAAHVPTLEATDQFLAIHVDPFVPGLGAAVLDLPVALVFGAVGIALFIFGLRSRKQTLRDADNFSSSKASAVATPRIMPGTELAHALRSCRGALIGIAVFSGVINLLMLTGSLFMLQVYDRVLPSRSLPTLIGLATLVAILFSIMAALDLIRVRLMGRIGTTLDAALSERVYDSIVRLPTRVGDRLDSIQPLRDLDSVRSFYSSLGPTALFDVPWLPFYLAIIFAFHPWLGFTALGGAIVLIAFTVMTDVLTRSQLKDAADLGAARYRFAEASRRNAEVLVAMDLKQRLAARWSELNHNHVAQQQRANDTAGGFGAISRTLRMALQSAVLGMGAYLVIQQQASAGIIIAAAILSARALAPVDLAIAHWRGFVTARQSWGRLKRLSALLPAHDAPMLLPAPTSTFSVENVVVVPPGEQVPVVHDARFTISGGQGLAIIGPSGSGKSSLVRALVGAWMPARGKVCLDGASLDQWAPNIRGRHIGYLPQEVELFAGTVAQNIARFDTEPDPEAIVRAARAAGVHELIVALPKGYETEIGDSGKILSAGQRQRIGLARALYGDPFLVVLDEPDSNLDIEGTQALIRAIQGVRKRGGIAMVVAHRQNILAHLDLVLALHRGRVLAMGPKETVMKNVRMAAPGQEPLKVVPA